MKNFLKKLLQLSAPLRILSFVFIFLFAVSCEKDYFPVPPPPKVPKNTPTLEASYNTEVPTALNDKFWKDADFHEVLASDLNTGQLYGDGFLNMTGLFAGKTGFNAGADPEIVLKAAYDDTKLYILAEWVDSDFNPAKYASLFDGPSDPLKTPESNADWTSQGNSDKIAFAFEIEAASSAAGTFSAVGCAASCHNGVKQPLSGKVDIWNWDLATSAPLGYAHDMLVTSDLGITMDAGQSMAVRNKADTADSRSKPAFEWDGVAHSVTHPDGKVSNLDPAFYMLNKTAFLGDPAIGKVRYANSNCGYCHGYNGEGGTNAAFNVPGFNRKHSRETIKTFATNNDHPGKTYYDPIPLADREHLIAFIIGISGVPGHYLQTPTASNADVWAISNVPLPRVNTLDPHTKYQVLLVRNLTTNNADDVQFTAPQGKEFVFGLALTDNDGKNHIGSPKEILTFLNKE